MNRHEITIDASGQSLGRLASRIALLLQDKHLPTYAPNKEGETKVALVNAGKIKFTGKKFEQKVYFRHTQGYVGHVKQIRLKEMFPRRPEWVIRQAISGMLPKNRLRDRRLKRLIVKK